MKAWWKQAFRREADAIATNEMHAMAEDTDVQKRLETLTSRENDVFALLLQGKKMLEIADALGIKFTTVNTHQKNIYRKLDVNSRAECFVRYGAMYIHPVINKYETHIQDRLHGDGGAVAADAAASGRARRAHGRAHARDDQQAGYRAGMDDVDGGHAAMMQDTVSLDIATVKGFKNVLFGGEGLFLTTLTGPGHVWLQCMPAENVAKSIIPFIPDKN